MPEQKRGRYLQALLRDSPCSQTIFFSNWNTATCCIWRNVWVKTRRDQELGMGQDITSICWMSGHLLGKQPLTSISDKRLTDPPPRTMPPKCCRAEHITAALLATPASQNHYVWTKILKFNCLTSASLYHWSWASINSRKNYYKSQHAHTAFCPLSEVSSLRFKMPSYTKQTHMSDFAKRKKYRTNPWASSTIKKMVSTIFGFWTWFWEVTWWCLITTVYFEAIWSHVLTKITLNRLL